MHQIAVHQEQGRVIAGDCQLMGCGERIRRVVKLFSGFDPCKVEPGSLFCLSEFFLYTRQLFTAAGIVIQEKRRCCSFLILCEQIQGLSLDRLTP